MKYLLLDCSLPFSSGFCKKIEDCRLQCTSNMSAIVSTTKSQGS